MTPPSPVAAARYTLGSHMGRLALFLFGVMAVSGLLLSAYYVPSTSPATLSDGRELGVARVTRELTWLGERHAAGETIALPLSTTGDSLDVPPAIRASVAPVVDAPSGRIIRPSAAWASVEGTITRGAELGGIIRSIHHYAAGLFVASLFLTLALAVLGRAVRAEHRRAWVGAASLLLLATAAAYTGSVLPWSRLAYAAMGVGASTPDGLPFVGPAIGTIVRGGAGVAQGALTRMHALHATLLPVAMALFGVLFARGLRTPAPRRDHPRAALVALGTGIALVIASAIDGAAATDAPLAALGYALLATALAAALGDLAAPRGRPEERPRRPYRDLIAWTLALGLLVTLALVAPWRPAGDGSLPVDLRAGTPAPEGARPEWGLMFAYGLVSALPTGAAAIATLLLAAALAGLPWLGRRAVVVGAVVLVALVAATIVGYAVG